MATPRPDLEAVPVSFPEYIADTIFPWMPRSQRAGVIYNQKLASDGTAQTGRSTAPDAVTGLTGSISRTILQAYKTNYATAEVRARYGMDPAERDGYKDLAHAELAMARRAKRDWWANIEQRVADALLKKDSGVTDISADPAPGIDAAVANMMDLGAPGDIYLVMSNANFVKLKANATVKDRMKNSGIVLGSGGDARAITREQMAAIFGVKGILIGKDLHWKTNVTAVGKSYHDNAALVVVPSAGLPDPAEEVQLGRLVYYDYTNQVRKYEITSFHDDLNDIDTIDAKGEVTLLTFNAELAKTFRIFGENAADPGESDSAPLSITVLSTVPELTAANEGVAFLYTGATNETATANHIYLVTESAETAGTYVLTDITPSA